MILRRVAAVFTGACLAATTAAVGSMALVGCSPQGEPSGPSTSPTLESFEGSSRTSPTSDGDQGSSSSSTQPPDSSGHPTTTMTITSLQEAGETLSIPADATVVVPEGADAFALRIPTCPSSGFDIDVTAEGNWIGRPATTIAGGRMRVHVT